MVVYLLAKLQCNLLNFSDVCNFLLKKETDIYHRHSKNDCGRLTSPHYTQKKDRCFTISLFQCPGPTTDPSRLVLMQYLRRQHSSVF